MIATMLSLVATALLVAVLLSTTLHSDNNSTTSITNAPGVAEADGLQAQQALTTGLTTAVTAASEAGGYSDVTPSALTSANPSTTFTSGPSTSASIVSIATNADSITLADRASDGTCWLAWKSTTGATWFGAQTDMQSCTAPDLTSAPVASTVSSSSIGWQEGSFPTP